MTVDTIVNIQNNSVAAKQEAAMKKQQDMYFKLLMAQLKHQDIDNPADSNEMIQTFLQMQNGQAMINMQRQLESLNGNLSKNFLQSMTGMIGKYALTKGNQFTVDQNSLTTPISYKIEHPGLHRLDIRILDEQNQVVFQDKITDIQGGEINDLTLNLRDKAGNLTLAQGLYKIEILPFTKDSNKPVNLDIFTSNRILQVLQDGSVITNIQEKLSLEEILALQEKPSKFA